MAWRVFGETFVTLVVITDPIGNAPIFLSVTRGFSPDARRRAAIEAVVAAGALIVVFATIGELVLRYLHVSISSLSIAGGLLLLLVALEMLRGTDFPQGDASDGVALVPLATPLVAGPGAIATAMVLWRNHQHFSGHVAVLAGIVASVACVGVALLVSERVTRTVRPSIIAFLTRVFGLLLSAIAVQLVIDGVKGIS